MAGRGGRRLLRRVGLCAVIWVFGSCSAVQGKLYIMEGNFFTSRGRYTEAAGSYLKAREYPASRGYAEFGLGAVYFALDEAAPALERFRAAEQALRETPSPAGPELAYRIRYNTGVAQFKEGDYAGAVRSFRGALAVDGGRIDAKRNLELSLLSLAQTKRLPSPAPSAAEPEPSGDPSPALFEYLRRKEQTLWKSRIWIEDAPDSGPDY